jgi:hypothetical protein
MNRPLVLGAALAGAFAFAAADASAITREEVLVRARSYAAHKWSATAANMTASCKAQYRSLYQPGDYVGVAYDWGGYRTLATFDSHLAQGFGAGSQESDGILACTTGVDCSGFVSMTWATGHFTTSSLHQTSSQITAASLLPGDVFNKAGYHVAMFTHMLQSGEPAMVEALGYNVHTNTSGGWSHVNGYVPRRFSGITGTTAGNPVGTTTNPIAIGAFPFTDSRDTRQSASSVLDACAVAPAIQQRGPEYVYLANLTQPGTLTVSVQDDAATDVDVQVLAGAPSPSRCVARHDSAVSVQVGCGAYYVVVDTFGPNASKAGPYTLNVTFAPSGQACSGVAGPPPFDPKGKLGDACSYPGNPNLGFCNANVGADTCIYTQTSSFCSKPCAGNADCQGMPGGGCCEELGSGEKYCMTQSLCGGGSSGANVGGSSGEPGSSSGGGGSSSGGSASGGTNPSDPNGKDPGDPDSYPENAGPVTVTNEGGCGIAPGAGGSGGIAIAAFALLSAARRRRRAR